MSNHLPEINFRQFPAAPQPSRCCLPDILSIRQQQQAAASMTDIQSGKALENQDEVCQCNIAKGGARRKQKLPEFSLATSQQGF